MTVLLTQDAPHLSLHLLVKTLAFVSNLNAQICSLEIICDKNVYRHAFGALHCALYEGHQYLLQTHFVTRDEHR